MEGKSARNFFISKARRGARSWGWKSGSGENPGLHPRVFAANSTLSSTTFRRGRCTNGIQNKSLGRWSSLTIPLSFHYRLTSSVFLKDTSENEWYAVQLLFNIIYTQIYQINNLIIQWVCHFPQIYPIFIFYRCKKKTIVNMCNMCKN